eukprot:CAMPEP_0205808188 /NCGR_PEP_ID=MMETSP0205-20121125/12069_1 /ASSEMBLY_ACC=CAM_ASM_000278 /TAXON_ID=36767 /ORGANISM="Euplotes focardii, Strain TN1" /LENGTH=174 /DNA_ID=CAMNT_0053083471 /DNA_START=377 /DNA_END=898 /DNA_ORIENTATION=-
MKQKRNIDKERYQNLAKKIEREEAEFDESKGEISEDNPIDRQRPLSNEEEDYSNDGYNKNRHRDVSNDDPYDKSGVSLQDNSHQFDSYSKDYESPSNRKYDDSPSKRKPYNSHFSDNRPSDEGYNRYKDDPVSRSNADPFRDSKEDNFKPSRDDDFSKSHGDPFKRDKFENRPG